MARPVRIEYAVAFYHVASRGNERKRIFHSKCDYEKFKSYLVAIHKSPILSNFEIWHTAIWPICLRKTYSFCRWSR